MQSGFNDKDMERIIKRAKSKGINVNEMKTAAQNGSLEDFIGKNLSPEANKKLKAVLSDKAATEKLLATDEAKALLNTLLNKGK